MTDPTSETVEPRQKAGVSTRATDIVEVRPPVPPFTRETAALKVRIAEDGWNSRDPERVSLEYSPDSRWLSRCTSSHPF